MSNEKLFLAFSLVLAIILVIDARKPIPNPLHSPADRRNIKLRINNLWPITKFFVKNGLRQQFKWEFRLKTITDIEFDSAGPQFFVQILRSDALGADSYFLSLLDPNQSPDTRYDMTIHQGDIVSAPFLRVTDIKDVTYNTYPPT